MSNIDKYDLLSNVISLINAQEFSATIENLAIECNAPLPFMRKTIVSLLSNPLIQSCLSTSYDYAENQESSFVEDYLDDPAEISSRIMMGDFDNIEWELDLKVLTLDADEILPLSHIEYSAIKSLGENILSIKRASVYEKKENSAPLPLNVRKNIEIIQNAISSKMAISIIYKKPNNEISQITLFPAQLITNVTDNWIYLQSMEGKYYRLDRFVHSCKAVRDAGNYPEHSPDPNQKYVWGAYYNRDAAPTHVKLRIADETSNIISKIKQDTLLRKDTCKFYRDGNYYYYEDDIIGMEEFQRWIRSYGSSVVVLEPESLHNDIINRAKQVLLQYEVSESWGEF